MTRLISEIIRLDGPDEPSFVVAFTDDDVHYFYWPYERTPKNLLGKANDVEPVKIQDKKVLSRFHYYGMTIWVNPDLSQTIPTVSFVTNFHSPIAISIPDCKIKTFQIANYGGIPWYEKPGYWLGKHFYKDLINSSRIENPRKYEAKIVVPQGEVFGRKVLFDRQYVIDYIKELIIIGKQNDIDNLISQIKQNDQNKKITPESLSDFFGFK